MDTNTHSIEIIYSNTIMLKDNANTNPYSTHSSNSPSSKEHSSSIVDYS